MLISHLIFHSLSKYLFSAWNVLGLDMTLVSMANKQTLTQTQGVQSVVEETDIKQMFRCDINVRKTCFKLGNLDEGTSPCLA